MRILIVKLGALGDVLRTTPLLTELKRRYPDARIDWVVDAKCMEALSGNTLIDRLRIFSEAVLNELAHESYDLAINLDKEPEALQAISAASAAQKRGFVRSASGELAPADELSDYAYRLGIDDELKFKLNQKTYQEISFGQLGFEFRKEPYLFEISEADRRAADALLREAGVQMQAKRPWIGLNTGSGTRFAGKQLSVEAHLDLIDRLGKEFACQILLLGGRDEVRKNEEISRRSSYRAVCTGSHPLKIFAGIVERCDLIISGDTTAMHIAIAMKTPVAVYFGSTCHAEIELYDRGRKIVSDIACSPCYKRICPIDDRCMKDLSLDAILSASRELLGHPVGR